MSGWLHGQFFTHRLQSVPFLLVKLNEAQRYASSFHVPWPLFITFSPMEIARLGH